MSEKKVRLVIEEKDDDENWYITTGISHVLEITYNKYTYTWQATDTQHTHQGEDRTQMGAIVDFISKRLGAENNG